MKVIFLDLDTLRPDHLGCYGYDRDTSPNIDKIASEGVVFDKYYCPNAPCLPSRASLVSGKNGIRNGILGHGGTSADFHLEGENRGFRSTFAENNLFKTFRKAGMYAVSFSTFSERHSAHWFTTGFNEVYNVGERGNESSEEVVPLALNWLENNEQEDWFIHLNLWDPHTPYRAPLEMGNVFESEELPHNWIDDEIFQEHLKHVGPHSANEISMYDDSTREKYPRQMGRLSTLEDVKNIFDQYDCGIKHMDNQIGLLLDKLEELNIYDDVAFIISSDHGENFGELGIYAEHATADEATCRIPMIIKWTGINAGRHLNKFYSNVDLYPTICDLLDVEKSKDIDGISYAGALKGADETGRDHIILSQCCHVAQRSARFDDWLYIKTYHGGFHLYDKEMLFNIKTDKFETRNLAKERPELCAKGAKLIFDWVDEMHLKDNKLLDPLWLVMAENGPHHTWTNIDAYIERLEKTGRGNQISKFKEMYNL